MKPARRCAWHCHPPVLPGRHAVWVTFRPERDAEIVRSLTMLQMINDKPAAEFWKEVDGK
jgi:hypothetical protein